MQILGHISDILGSQGGTWPRGWSLPGICPRINRPLLVSINPQLLWGCLQPMDLDWRLFFFSCASNCGKSVLRQLLRVCSLAALPWLKGWVSNFPEHKWFNGTGRISWKYWIRNFMPSGPMHLSVSTPLWFACSYLITALTQFWTRWNPLELISVLNACWSCFQILGLPVVERLPRFGKQKLLG